MLARAKSAQVRHKPLEMETLEEELHHQVKKSSLLDGERTEFWKHAEDIKDKNKEEIERLKVENNKLKLLRD